MKILVLGTSLSKTSINKQFANYAAQYIGRKIKDVEIEDIDLNNYEVDLYSEERENKNGVPEKIKELFTKIQYADLLIISFAEHNGTYSAAYKNTIDWLSRINPELYLGRDVVFLSTSPGHLGASSVLNQAIASAKYFAANILFSYSLADFYENFKNGEIKGELGELFEKRLDKNVVRVFDKK